MVILFSPSEAKRSGGGGAVVNSSSFVFPELYSHREDVLKHYAAVMERNDSVELSKMFGLKKPEEIEHYAQNLFQLPTMKVVERYDGVAYRHLDYDSLSIDEKKYVDENTVIFSNLFGPILAGNQGLPEYKLKQGEKVGGLAPEKLYKEAFSKSLDAWIGEKPVVDLRAGFYEKFYTLQVPYVTFRFIKSGQVVSHYAKAYRGIILRRMAEENVKTQEDLGRLEIPGVRLLEMRTSGLKFEYVLKVE